MPIVGHGIDLVDTARVERLLRAHGERFLARCFTPAERTHCEGRRRTAEHLAGRFAAKEAIVKALGTGVAGGIGWRDAEVRAGAAGEPRVVLHGRARAVAADRGAVRWWLSISHQGGFALASAVAEA